MSAAQDVATAQRAPVVLPFAPREGWVHASTQRRLLAVGYVALLVLWQAVFWLPGGTAEAWTGAVELLGAVYLLLGPVACHAAARVLRPYPPGAHTERQLRHGCAAVAAAYGTVLLQAVLTPSAAVAPSTASLMMVLAVTLGLVTLVWGAVAVVVRAATATAAS